MPTETKPSAAAAPGGAPFWKERMAIALARDIVDGERIISGAHTEISFAAAMLAQKMHAPNIKLQLGGTCFARAAHARCGSIWSLVAFGDTLAIAIGGLLIAG